MAAKKAGEKYLSIPRDAPIIDSPQRIAAHEPTDAEFNKIFDDLFDGHFIDVAKAESAQSLAEHFAKANANDLYITLKRKSLTTHGAVYVNGVPFQGEDKILIFARIAYSDGKKKYLISEVIHISFIHKAGLKDVVVAIPTKQEMPSG
jgi:hypothetical protein